MKILSEQTKKQDCYEILGEESEPNIPLSDEKRRNTDRWFLFVFILSIIVLGVFPLIHVLSYSDVNRYNGYDSCGNICGQKNDRYDQWDCTGRDFTLKPLYDFSNCISKEELYDRDSNPFWLNPWNLSGNIKSLAARVAIKFLFPFVICLILAVLFRYVTAMTVWVLLILCITNPIIPGSFVYLRWIFVFPIPIFLAIYIPILLLIICVLVAARRKIALVIIMLKEASNTVFATPRVIPNAIRTSITLFLMIIIVSVGAFFSKTSGILTEIWSERLDYLPTSYMIIGDCLCIVIALWIVLYLLGFGFVNTSAVVTSKYFSRKEENNAGPTSRYHSGTIAITSLLSPIMAIPRLILATLAQISVLQNLMDLCLRYVDGYFSKNVYIVTAMHGTSFAQSGKKAVKLSKASVGNTLSVLNFADYLLLLIQISVTISTNFIYVARYNGKDTVFDILFDYAIAFVSTELVLGHVKVAMSTIFFCVCQDNLLKKEAKESYTMSQEEYLISSHKYFAFKTKEKYQSRLSLSVP